MSEANRLVLGFHHPGITVPDLDAGVAFYSQLLGYEVVVRSAWEKDNKHFNQIVGLQGSAARFCMLKGANAYLELFEYSAPAPKSGTSAQQANALGIRHLAFLVSDVEEALRRCVELGGSKMNEPSVVPGRAAAVYCRDPFGNLLELVQSLGGFPELTNVPQR